MRASAITPSIGSILDGIDADSFKDPAILDAIYQHLLDRHVVILPDLALMPADQAQLARSLGPVAAPHHHYQRHPDCDDVVVIEWSGDDEPDAAEWHADMTFRGDPPFATVLHSMVIPETGGDTLWANLHAVYESLPAGLQADLEQLQAAHDIGAFRTPAWQEGGNVQMADTVASAGMAVHPIVTRHPATGRPYLNVSESFTRWVIGMSAPESARLLTMLFDLINRPQFHMRLRWQPRMTVIWDNRGTQHYAVNDYLPARRVMHRVVVEQDGRLQEGS